MRDGWLGLSLGWLCMARMVLEATGAPLVRRLGSGAARPLSQLMTYRSLFVVASGQNACFRPARLLLSSRRNNRRKDDHGGELCQVGLTCNMVGGDGGWGPREDNKPSRRMGRRGPRVGRDDDSCRTTERSTACFAGSAECSRQQALVERRAGPCPAVISSNQTNMIEPQATVQWRHRHSLLLLVRNPNPSIHRDSRSIYILRRPAVVPRLDEVRVAQKRVANMPRCRFGRPAECKSLSENGSQTLLRWVFGFGRTAGAPPVAIRVPRPEPGRSNVLPMAGKDLGCGGFPRYS